MKKIILLMICSLLAVSCSLDVSSEEKSDQEKDVHYHAGFVVYQEGVLKDFTGWQYMNILPCEAHEKGELTPEEYQLEKAHLHDQNGDVVHVHQEGAIWADLFKNIGFDIPGDVAAYKDGAQIEDPLNKSIEPYESLVFIVGDSVEKDISTFTIEPVSRQRIEYVESLPESCGI